MAAQSRQTGFCNSLPVSVSQKLIAAFTSRLRSNVQTETMPKMAEDAEDACPRKMIRHPPSSPIILPREARMNAAYQCHGFGIA
jgi:hypothetical protein